MEACAQAINWQRYHPECEAFVSSGLLGYRFNCSSSSSAAEYHQQLVPGFASIDDRMWASLSAESKSSSYPPCVPAVII
ncbi:hypothetical protein L917_02663 [Phytophthora nicotianae]|uniref:Uncharacterized protein n=1 Tax=Phytophthora nicotianae TaxID=4792 RepID=W2LTE9_PHYNI|nr:hypothetical protein L917_02663 [Phytophthora nicotianae]